MKTTRIVSFAGMLVIGLMMTPTVDARAHGRGAHHAKPAGEAGDHDGGTRDPGVNARQKWQKERTEQGVKSGQLTKDETKDIAKDERAIRKEERQYKSDGTLTKDERKDLHRDLNATSKEIYQDKHNADTQPGVTPAEPGKLGTRDPGVNARQHNQSERIEQGVKSGQLTKDEAKGLASEEKAIRQEERQYKSDGNLSVEERKDLHQDLNKASKDIYQEKHDADTRSGTPASTTSTTPSTTTSSSATPGTRDPGVNARQENQQDRIAQGVKSGELTKKEAAKLEWKEKRVAALEKKLKEDGSLTASDRAKLQKQLDALSADIYKQKHDGQEQPKAQ